MCAYCEEQKPLFFGTSITKNGIRSKSVTIQGGRIVKIETIMETDTFKPADEVSDFELDYCPKCGKGLTKKTMDVQSIRESDKE